MQIIYPPNGCNTPAIAACIGFFDGVHRGHRFLIEQLIVEARKRGVSPAVITFRSHPRKLIDPQFCPHLLSSFDEKMELLAQTGIDYCFVLDFTDELRNLTAREFIQDILKQQIHTQILLIGYDHRFGKNREEGFEEYRQYGIECGIQVIKEPDYTLTGRHISSSTIRKNLLAGKMEEAAEISGKQYNIRGMVTKGFQLGRTLGYPTANIQPDDLDKLIPLQGVYAAYTEIDGSLYPAMVNIGQRPTVSQSEEITIEAHLIGFEGDLYGKHLNIHFVSFLRPEKRMESLCDLKAQLNLDKENTLRLLNERTHLLR